MSAGEQKREGLWIYWERKERKSFIALVALQQSSKDQELFFMAKKGRKIPSTEKYQILRHKGKNSMCFKQRISIALTTLAMTHSQPSGICFMANSSPLRLSITGHFSITYTVRTVGRYEDIIKTKLFGELITSGNGELFQKQNTRQMARTQAL